MARAAVPGRLTGRLAWRVARLVDHRDETPTARTLVLAVPGWPGHLPGQHVDVRLTAADGYSTQRSYSIASAAGTGDDRLELTVQLVPDGEVSPYLTRTYAIGDPVEVRGPVGGWFVWHPTGGGPVLLVAGGSGIVPLMAMIRARAAAASQAPFRLLYSARTPDDVYYAGELRARTRSDAGLAATVSYSRRVPPGHRRPPGLAPACFVCGPTGFVETVADLLVSLGHDPGTIRTERFGPSGGSP